MTAARRGSVVGLIYAVVCYLLFLAGFAYFFGFLNDLWVPKGIDTVWIDVGAGAAIAIDVGLVLLWGLQHSGMARPRFKTWWTRTVPPHSERATYVLASTLALSLVFAGWVPVAGQVWHASGSAARIVIWVLQGLGWAFLLAASFEIDHFELFGLKQPLYAMRGKDVPEKPFQSRFLYRVVRHPIQTGVLVAIWATPDMTVSHLLFAVLMTVYVLVGLAFEERDLVGQFGDRYRDYRRRVAKLVPFTRKL